MDKQLVMDYENTTLKHNEIVANFLGKDNQSHVILKKNDIMWEVVHSPLSEPIVDQAFKNFISENGFSFDDEDLARAMDIKIRSGLRLEYERELAFDLESLKNSIKEFRSTGIKKYPNVTELESHVNELSMIVDSHLFHKLINDYSDEKSQLLKIKDSLDSVINIYYRFDSFIVLIIQSKNVINDNPKIAAALLEPQKQFFESNKETSYATTFSEFKEFKDKDIPLGSNTAKISLIKFFLEGFKSNKAIMEHLATLS